MVQTKKKNKTKFHGIGTARINIHLLAQGVVAVGAVQLIALGNIRRAKIGLLVRPGTDHHGRSGAEASWRGERGRKLLRAAVDYYRRAQPDQPHDPGSVHNRGDYPLRA